MNEYREPMLNVFKKYLETREQDDQSRFFSYDIIEKIKSTNLFPLHSEYLASDFMEIINSYHNWTIRLMSWAAWNDVLQDFHDDETKAWEIRNEFLDPIVYLCLHQPSSFKDVLIKYCTIAFHLANSNFYGEYKDNLDEDTEVFRRLQKNHAEPYNYFLSRSDAEKQLKRISLSWPIGNRIVEALAKLDSKTYKEQSQSWRNHAAHYIPPRLHFGYTRPVTRQVGFFKSLIDQLDGTFLIHEDKTRKQIAYGFGGTPPLEINRVFEANFQQHAVAHEILALIHDLLNEIISINLAKDSPSFVPSLT
jgi:hypothetical protein